MPKHDWRQEEEDERARLRARFQFAEIVGSALLGERISRRPPGAQPNEKELRLMEARRSAALEQEQLAYRTASIVLAALKQAGLLP